MYIKSLNKHLSNNKLTIINSTGPIVKRCVSYIKKTLFKQNKKGLIAQGGALYPPDDQTGGCKSFRGLKYILVCDPISKNV